MNRYLVSLAVFLGASFGCSTTEPTAPIVRKSEVAPVVPEARMMLVTLPELRDTLYFDSENDLLSLANQLTLEPFALRLQQQPEATLTVVGHTDSRGSVKNNLALSEERAHVVASHIISAFQIDKERVFVVGKGESEPLNRSNTKEAHQQNRRIELITPQIIVQSFQLEE